MQKNRKEEGRFLSIVEPSAELWSDPQDFGYRQILIAARAAGLSHRTDHKFEEPTAAFKAHKFLEKVGIDKGHESVLEHINITFLLTISRIISHQQVRHRPCAYTQESTRYINFKEPIFITPPGFSDWPPPGRYTAEWLEGLSNMPETLQEAYWGFESYKEAISKGYKRESARYLLPQCLATRIAVTANLRQWRHMMKERGINKHAAPEIRKVYSQIINTFKSTIPFSVKDIEEKDNDL